MRILIINPNSDERTDQIIAKKAKELHLPGVDVDVTHVEHAPKLVSSYQEQACSQPEMAETIS